MDPKLQQAVVATRAGQTQKAQLLLGQLIQENPDDANAWFLLSQLVDSDERATLYLNRVLEIEPDYAPAKARLETLTTTAATAATAATAEERTTSAVAEADGAVPDWLQEESAASEAVVTAAVDEETGLPDWLRDLEEVESPPPAQEAAAPAATRTAAATAAAPSAKPAAAPAKKAQTAPAKARQPVKKNRSDAWLTGILVFLILVAIVVMGALVYLVFTG